MSLMLVNYSPMLRADAWRDLNSFLQQRPHNYSHRSDEGYVCRRMSCTEGQRSIHGNIGSQGSRPKKTAPIPRSLLSANRNTRRLVLVLEEAHAHRHEEKENAQQDA